MVKSVTKMLKLLFINKFQEYPFMKYSNTRREYDSHFDWIISEKKWMKRSMWKSLDFQSVFHNLNWNGFDIGKLMHLDDSWEIVGMR